VLHAPAPSAVLLLVQLLAVQLLAVAAVQLLPVQLLAATAAADAAQLLLVQLLAATAAPAVQLLLVAHVPQQLQLPLLLSAHQSHQLLSSSCPYRENLTACDPLDRKPFCIRYHLKTDFPS
jgi:hypothetical protein